MNTFQIHMSNTDTKKSEALLRFEKSKECANKIQLRKQVANYERCLKKIDSASERGELDTICYDLHEKYFESLRSKGYKVPLRYIFRDNVIVSWNMCDE
jgi:hypothetical protein